MLTRRQVIASAAAIGATCAFGGSRSLRSSAAWTEMRARFPEGVASGDPQPDSVILWTRCPATAARPSPEVTVEVAEDPAFRHIVTRARTKLSGQSDWTCRVLVGGLRPAREYWYRFIDANGEGSRLGRTLTAPAPEDARTVRFAFVSCQNCNDGAQNAYRRMIFEDEKAAPDQRLGFVMHLGDFFYEIVWYPEDRPQGMYDRRMRDILRYPTGEKIEDFHVPADLADYRTIYRAYLHDLDIQDARARWPFVCMGDNHEFSWKGWQSQEDFGGVRPAQTRKVAANQAWFEYQPSRVEQPSGRLDQFVAPIVKNAPIETFDDHGLGLQADNLAAIGSLTTYRRRRFGLRPRAATGADYFGRSAAAQFPQRRATAVDARQNAKGLVPEAAQRFERYLEAVGQLGGCDGCPRRSAQPSARRRAQVAGRRLRHLRARRLGRLPIRARADLGSHPR